MTVESCCRGWQGGAHIATCAMCASPRGTELHCGLSAIVLQIQRKLVNGNELALA